MIDDKTVTPHPASPDREPAVIDELLIRRLIRSFYDRARDDEMIGPIFKETVGDWEGHIAKITDFWCSLMLRSDRYRGQPLRPHLALPLEEKHFDRWLALFEANAREVCPDVAAAFIDKARRIADSFEMAIGTHRGEIKSPRHSRQI